MELQKSLLEKWKFISRFLNTLTADDKYPLINREYWKQLIHMRLSQKQNIFSESFSAFLEFPLNSEHFQKKDDPHGLCISVFTDHERGASINI